MKRRSTSRGVALIQALLIVAALAAVATALLIRADAARERLDGRFRADQAALHLSSGVELLRATLPTGVVHARQDWARPRDGVVIGAGLLAWEVADLQGRFNVNLLLDDDRYHAAFTRLASAQGLSGTATRRALALIVAHPQDLTRPDLLALGAEIDTPAWADLQPYLSAFPEGAGMNLNTLSEPVLTALLPQLEEPGRAALIDRIRSEPFEQPDDAIAWAANALGPEAAEALQALPLTTRSRLFEAQLAVQLDSLVLRRSVVIDTGGPAGVSAVVMSLPGSR